MAGPYCSRLRLGGAGAEAPRLDETARRQPPALANDDDRVLEPHDRLDGEAPLRQPLEADGDDARAAAEVRRRQLAVDEDREAIDVGARDLAHRPQREHAGQLEAA